MQYFLPCKAFSNTLITQEIYQGPAQCVAFGEKDRLETELSMRLLQGLSLDRIQESETDAFDYWQNELQTLLLYWKAFLGFLCHNFSYLAFLAAVSKRIMSSFGFVWVLEQSTRFPQVP